MAADRLVKFSALAQHLGVARSYVTELRHAGRLALSDDGRRCWLHASVQRIEATRDPAQDVTRARHAEARATAPESAQAHADPTPSATAPTAAAGDVGGSYQAARAVKERYLALEAKRAYEQATGKLVAAEDVRHALANAATTLRVRLETLPGSLAAQLAAARDEARIRALLADEVEALLAELSRSFATIGQEASA
jgi:hypothetical protein